MKEAINKPFEEWTAIEIAAYAVNCDNSNERIEEIAEMIKGFAQRHRINSNDENWPLNPTQGV